MSTKAQDNQYCDWALDLLQHVTDFKNLAGIKKELDGACFICQELNPICNYWMLGKCFSESIVYSTMTCDVVVCAFSEASGGDHSERGVIRPDRQA